MPEKAVSVIRISEHSKWHIALYHHYLHEIQDGITCI